MPTSPSPNLTNQKVPVVDHERLTQVYGELKGMTIKLDPNPIDYGPTRFNNRIAKVRALLTRVEQIFLQASEDLHWYKRRARAKRTMYELERRDLMINDPKCRVGRSQGEREALADVQLRAQIEAIEDLSSKAEDLEILMIVIKSKRTDLKDIQGRMRDQMKLIEHDLGMGARWGKEAPPSLINDSMNDITSLLANVDVAPASDDLITEETEEEEEEEEETVEEEAVEEVIEVVDDHHDPSPTAGTVLEFVASDLDEPDETEEAPAASDESDDPSYDEDPGEPIIPEEDAVGDLPASLVSDEEADDFLDSFVPAESAPEEAEHPDEGSIEDLISSLADD
jgi:cellulose biosynthesis protein BcsQ